MLSNVFCGYLVRKKAEVDAAWARTRKASLFFNWTLDALALLAADRARAEGEAERER